MPRKLIDYTDSIYLEFGADQHVEGLGQTEEVKEIRKRAIRAGLKLVDCPIRHLGTEKAQKIYLLPLSSICWTTGWRSGLGMSAGI